LTSSFFFLNIPNWAEVSAAAREHIVKTAAAAIRDIRMYLSFFIRFEQK
jgi:hypothetical protein